jgi:DNA-binding transcriptional ArsR family regulator
MVEYHKDVLDVTFGALANPVRRDLLERLAGGELTVTELARPYEISLAGVSKHLQVLEQAGLVTRRIQGRKHMLSLQPSSMMEAALWLVQYRRFWDDSLHALETLARQGGR